MIGPTPPATVADDVSAYRGTSLSGQWLLIARAGWIVVTLAMLALSAIAIPNAAMVLQLICKPGTQCNGTQLTPQDVRLLHQFGISPASWAAFQVGWDVAIIVFYTALAALLFWRRSKDRMALFCAYMLVLEGAATFTGLFDLGLRPLGPAWYWPVSMIETIAQVSYFTFFLLFPDGRFVPSWTRWGVLVVAVAELHYVFVTEPLPAAQSGPADFLAFAALALGLVALQVYRYRRVSMYRERQQTKWVVLGFTLAIVGFVATFLLWHMVFSDEELQSQVVQNLIGIVSGGFLLFIPFTIGIAILRGGLWDVDVLINRTLVYASLTVALAAVYFGSVVGMQHLASTIAGAQAGDNPLIIVISTLIIAALFTPLRRRIQTTIDRRFYRRKYDAAKTLERFAASLRSEIELNDLREHLVGVVEETMRPTRVSLWLRKPAGHDSGGQ